MAIALTRNYRGQPKAVLQEPHPLLRRFSKPVKKLDKSIELITTKLIKVLKQVDKPYLFWLGIAPPQIGLNRWVVAIKQGFHSYLVMINPQVIQQRFWLPVISGYFSLKSFYLIVSPYWLRVRYEDLSGKEHVTTFLGGKAVVL